MAALSYLTGTVTQGGADAFASAELTTALSGVTNIAYRVREILSNFNTTAFAAGDACTVQLALSRRAKTAMPLITDRDVLWQREFRVSRTTSGMLYAEQVRRDAYGEDDDLLIVEDPLYLLIDSNGTALANTGYVRIGYTRESISVTDRLTLLTQSLD